MSQFQNFFPDETILAETNGFMVKGFFGSKMGFAVLTNKRLAFIEKKMVVGGGLAGALIAEAAGVTKPKLKLDLPIEDIHSWERPRKNDLRVFTQRGEKHLFRPLDFEDWDKKLKSLKG